MLELAELFGFEAFRPQLPGVFVGIGIEICHCRHRCGFTDNIESLHSVLPTPSVTLPCTFGGCFLRAVAWVHLQISRSSLWLAARNLTEVASGWRPQGEMEFIVVKAKT